MIKTPGSPDDSFAFTNINYDPGTAMLIGAGVNAGSQIMAGQAAMKAGRYQQAMHERNATILENKSDIALQKGKDNIDVFNQAFDRHQSSTELAYMKSGVRMEGTPLEVLEYQLGEAEIQRLSLEYDAAVNSYDFLEQSAIEKSSGEYAMYQARSQRAASYISAAGTMVGAYAQKSILDTQAANQAEIIKNQNQNAAEIIRQQSINNGIINDAIFNNQMDMIDLINKNQKALININKENSLSFINKFGTQRF